MSKGRTSERFSMGELSALLDDDSDGHRLAEFLLRKNGGLTRPRRVFPEHKSERFSIDIRTEKIKTPVEEKNASSPTTKKEGINDAKQSDCDVAKVQEVQQAIEEKDTPKQDKKKITTSAAGFRTTSPVMQPPQPPSPQPTVAATFIAPTSPSQRLSLRRSGGPMPSADRLRRFSLKRLSTLSVGRKLLKEFDSTVSDSNFLPPICSTPVTHTTKILPVGQTSAKNNNLEDILPKTVESGVIANPSSSSIGTHNNTEKMLKSLCKHDAALQQMLERDPDTTMKQTHEKENLHRNIASTTSSQLQKNSIQPISNSINRPTTPIYNSGNRRTTSISNSRSRPTTPVSNHRSHITAPISNARSRTTTPISNLPSRPTTPTSNERSRTTTPISNLPSRPTTPTSNARSRPTTPISNLRRHPTAPSPNQTSRPSTPVDNIKRRTYTIQRGSEPGQVVLTPAKSQPVSEQPQQYQQPTSTEEDGVLELPTSPVEEAVYKLHTVCPVEPDSPEHLLPLPAEPVIASPKVLRVVQRYGLRKSSQTGSTMKSNSLKKSRIPLMTSAAKLKSKASHLDIVPNTPEVRVNTSRRCDVITNARENGVEILDAEIPETQDLPIETQKLLESLKRNQSTAPMIVIPIHQTFNHTPPQSHTITVAGQKVESMVPSSECHYYKETTKTPVNIEPDTTMCPPTANTTKRADGKQMKDKSQTPCRHHESPMPEIVPNEDDLRLCDILSDEDIISPVSRKNRRFTTNKECQLECSDVPLNLAKQQQCDSRSSSATRSKRLRKRSTTRRTYQQLSPQLSTETESEVGPPRAHQVITSKQFATGLRTHLAHLNNYEILDLRKRNSLGKVFPISGRRKSSLGHKSSLSAKQAFEQQLQLEEEIQMEIFKRQLNGQGEGLGQHPPESVPATIETEGEQPNEIPPFETEEIFDLTKEEANLLSVIPPAPPDFRDVTTRQSLAKSVLWHSYVNSSLVDERSCDQVKFVSPNVSKKSTQSAKTRRRSGRRKQKPVPEVMQKYLEVHSRINRSRKVKSSANQTKRSLYSEDTDKSFSDNSNIEQVKSPPKTASTTPRAQKPTQQRNETVKNLLSTTTSRSLIESQPLPPPDTYADELVHTNVAESMAISSVAGTSMANNTDSNVFKKPKLPAPKRKQTRKRTNGKGENNATNDTQKGEETPLQKNNNNDDVLQTNTAEPHDETSTVRRSKRGPKPLQNYWSFRSTDPTPLYDIVILERRRAESKQLRSARLHSSKTSLIGENSTIPTASSTINSNKSTNEIKTNGKNKRGRQKKPTNLLGDTDSSSLSAASSVSSGRKQKRLTMIQETDSQLVTEQMPIEQLPSKQNLGDNMFKRLDEVDISMVRTHKISRTPEQNNSAVPKKSNDVEKIKTKGKKSGTKNAKNASIIEKKPPQPKKLTRATAKKIKNQEVNAMEEEAMYQQEVEKEIVTETEKGRENENLEQHNATDASGSAQLLAIHSSTAAHINDIFNKLKNNSIANATTTETAITASTTIKTQPKNATNSINKETTSTAKKSCRVRVSRLKSFDVSQPRTTRSISRNSSRATSVTLQSMNDDDISSNAPAWLRDISHVGSKILTDSNKEKELFEQMLCSQPGNLVLTDVDGLDYAYYENNKDIPFGYMRFQPNQAKRTKRARYYNLRFFVLSGIFKICTNKDVAHFSEGSVITILKGSSYSITNLTDKLAILMVFRK